MKLIHTDTRLDSSYSFVPDEIDSLIKEVITQYKALYDLVKPFMILLALVNAKL